MGNLASKLHWRSRREQHVEHPSPVTSKSSHNITPNFQPPGGGNYKSTPSAYVLPSDSSEQARLNSQHYLCRFLLEGNQLTPDVREGLQRGITVLDAGCGTGIWSMDMARDYPASSFTAYDMVDAYKRFIDKKTPANCQFLTANTLDLPFLDNSFDYVFQRLQNLSFRENEWPRAISELVRVTKPGGWIELVDMDGFLHGGPWMTKIYSYARLLYKFKGVNPEFVHTFREALESAGLDEIEQGHRSVPVGWGPDEIAQVSARNVETALLCIKDILHKDLGIDTEEYLSSIKHAMEEAPEYQTHWHLFYAYGRKPFINN